MVHSSLNRIIIEDSIPFRKVLKFKYSKEKFCFKSNYITLVVQVHGPGVDSAPIYIGEEGGEQDVNE
jgi:hypothetical protein